MIDHLDVPDLVDPIDPLHPVDLVQPFDLVQSFETFEQSNGSDRLTIGNRLSPTDRDPTSLDPAVRSGSGSGRDPVGGREESFSLISDPEVWQRVPAWLRWKIFLQVFFAVVPGEMLEKVAWFGLWLGGARW
jgi:hypothetical protein